MDTNDPDAKTMYAAAGILGVILALSNMPTPFYVRWQAEMDFSSSILTILFAAYILGLLVALAVTSGLVSRFGERVVILGGMVLATGASCLFAFARAEWVLLLARGVTGVAVGAVLAAGIPWVTALGGDRRTRLALSLASGAVSTGAGVGPILSGVATTAPWDPIVTAFLIEAALLVASTALALKLPFRGQSSTVSRGHAGLLPRVPRRAWRHVGVGVASFGCALGMTAFLLSLGPSVLRDVGTIDGPMIAGVMASSMFLSGAVVQLPGRRLGPLGALALGGCSTVAAAAALALTVVLRSPLPLTASALLAGAGYGLAQLAGLMVIADGIEPPHRPQATALLNLGGYVPCGLLPIVAGVATDALGLTGSSLLFAAIIAALTTTATLLAIQGRARAGA